MSESDDRKLGTKNLNIRTLSGRLLVTITTEGELVYGPDYTPDEAAKAFWRAVARSRAELDEAQVRLATPEEVGILGMEERFNEWEAALEAVGVADIEHQNAQTRRNELVGQIGKKPAIEAADLEVKRTRDRLNELAYTVVELGRAHVLRKHMAVNNEFEAPADPAPTKPDVSKLN